MMSASLVVIHYKEALVDQVYTTLPLLLPFKIITQFLV